MVFGPSGVPGLAVADHVTPVYNSACARVPTQLQRLEGMRALVTVHKCRHVIHFPAQGLGLEALQRGRLVDRLVTLAVRYLDLSLCKIQNRHRF